jgi:2-phosphoglycerate kinase
MMRIGKLGHNGRDGRNLPEMRWEASMVGGVVSEGQLSHVLWMGGSPCSGKSSIAHLLAEEYGLREYHCDDMYEEHLRRVVPERQPVMSRVKGMTWDEVWMHPVGALVERELAFYREDFEMVLQDLLALPSDRPVIAEGSALLPECVAPLLIRPQQAIWVVPEEEFQRREYGHREWAQGVLAHCTQPGQAWENWMGRDAGFARAVAKDAEARGLKVLVVDGGRSIEANARTVAAHFGLVG